jgi:hypothetical protein
MESKPKNDPAAKMMAQAFAALANGTPIERYKTIMIAVAAKLAISTYSMCSSLLKIMGFFLMDYKEV